MTKYLQNRIAQSRWTLSFVALYALLVGAVALPLPGSLPQLVLLALTTLVMVELNNSNALIRIYSRMVSCSYLAMAVMAQFLLCDWPMPLLQLSTALFLLFYFRAYQDPQASGSIFYAFTAIGVASTVWVQVLYLMPILWILLATRVLAFSGRTFFASLLGILTPYWFIATYMLIWGDISYFNNHFLPLLQVSNPLTVLMQLDLPRLLTAAFVLLVAIISSLHYWAYSYLDKIRTRMIYEMLIVIDGALFVFMLLQSQHLDALLSMTIIVTAPIAGHYIALSHSKISNITFHIITLLTLLLTGFNVWTFSSLFS